MITLEKTTRPPFGPGSDISKTRSQAEQFSRLLRLETTTMLLLLLLGTGLVLARPSPPYWGGNPIYAVLVNLTNPAPIAKWQFQYYYNWKLQASRMEHYPPQYDEMCQDLPYGGEFLQPLQF